MIRRLLADAHENGVAAIEINVDAGDVDAQRFYERHGFSGADPDTGERAFYYSRELHVGESDLRAIHVVGPNAVRILDRR